MTTTPSIPELTERIREQSAFVEPLLAEIGKVVVGQRLMLDRILIGLLTGGHVLLEGVPGLAKTLTIKSVAQAVHATYSRIQFTPDLLPADVIGTQIYRPQTSDFAVRKGPVFANFVLADEINRAPAKVQSALLEAMQERQVTIGDETFHLPDPFLVMATQNPIEQEGTYPLPEAQVDRFMLKIKVTYPARDEELKIMDRMIAKETPTVSPVIDLATLNAARAAVHDIYIDDKIKHYILDIVNASRHPADHKLKELEPLILYGASPRASLSLAQASRAHAFLRRRGYVTPDDVKAIGLDVRHRIAPTYEAEAEDVTSESLVQRIFNTVEVP